MKKIEIFTANCPMCDPVVKMVQELACSNCEVSIYDMVKQCEDKICLDKAKEYGVNRVPAVAVDGKLLNCCQSNTITKESLIAAGIGQN